MMCLGGMGEKMCWKIFKPSAKTATPKQKAMGDIRRDEKFNGKPDEAKVSRPVWEGG
jgi:hypothetical protein